MLDRNSQGTQDDANIPLHTGQRVVVHAQVDGEQSYDLLRLLRRSKVMVVSAHPDDETIGAGSLLAELEDPTLIHVTDGAPRDLRDALANGFSSRADYATARLRELHNALATGGIACMESVQLNFADQEASLKLVELTCALVDHIRRLRPEIIVTHPYEGGHPDHDATAFGVHAARAILCLHEDPVPKVVEMTSYHSSFGEMAVARFLSAYGIEQTELHLSPEQRQIKRRMFDCFVTQQKVLAAFPIESEKFRLAPVYNFTEPPHSGQLFYEQFCWGMTSARWCKLTRAAMEKLGLPEESDFSNLIVCAK